MATPTDAELWHQARRGDVTAFGGLYERHARSVNLYCLWCTAAKQLAEEVTATAFLEAWRRRRRLELTTESAAPLVFGVTSNVLHNYWRNYWRNQRRHARALDRISKADLSPWDEREAIARVDAMSEVREAGAAIRALPQREREVFALLVWGELSDAETASALGIPIGIVRSRLVRARSRLGGAGSCGRFALSCQTLKISLLLPNDSALAAQRRALEASCGLPARNLFGWAARAVPAGRSGAS